MARPRAIQEGNEVHRLLMEAFAVGASVKVACGYAGISEATYYEEANRNPEFAEAAARRKHAVARRCLDLILDAASQDWRAAEAMLKLVFPQEYARSRIEHSGPEGGPIEVTAVRERLAGELDRLAERRREALPSVHPNGQGS